MYGTDVEFDHRQGNREKHEGDRHCHTLGARVVETLAIGEHVANTSYELTFALFALILFIYMKSKHVKMGPVKQNKDKILAAVFETAGQFTYVYALGGVDAVAAPILSSVCVVSLVLSRIFLKEKLPKKTYFFIAIVIIGILLLAVAEEL